MFNRRFKYNIYEMLLLFRTSRANIINFWFHMPILCHVPDGRQTGKIILNILLCISTHTGIMIFELGQFENKTKGGVCGMVTVENIFAICCPSRLL